MKLTTEMPWVFQVVYRSLELSNVNNIYGKTKLLEKYNSYAINKIYILTAIYSIIVVRM